MSRISEVNHRYDAVQSLIANGVSIFAIEDPAGERLNTVTREIRALSHDDGEGPLDELIRTASMLRWRRITQPQPNRFSPLLADLSDRISQDADTLRNFVGAASLLDELTAAATAAVATDNPVGVELFRSIEEVEAEACVVIASGIAARAGLHEWLRELGARVIVASELSELPREVELSYVVGPPSFLPRGLFPRGLVTSPVTPETTFLMPSWFDRQPSRRTEYVLAKSEFSELAEGGIDVRAKVYSIGDPSESTQDFEEPVEEELYFPQPIWGSSISDDREAAADEVEAWKVLLSGGLALWLDNGDRIRSLDPSEPAGDRVGNESVDDVRPGTYLVLREGATEHGAMYAAALEGLGDRAPNVVKTQACWKETLDGRLTEYGLEPTIRALKLRGIKSASRVRAWTDPMLICPKSSEDLKGLLNWLQIPDEPTFSNATSLRRSLYKASADLGRQLEEAVDAADLKGLERNGLMSLDLAREGFRGMLVSRVLARSPFTKIVPRQKVRIPFLDSGAKWLE